MGKQYKIFIESIRLPKKYRPCIGDTVKENKSRTKSTTLGVQGLFNGSIVHIEILNKPDIKFEIETLKSYNDFSKSKTHS